MEFYFVRCMVWVRREKRGYCVSPNDLVTNNDWVILYFLNCSTNMLFTMKFILNVKRKSMLGNRYWILKVEYYHFVWMPSKRKSGKVFEQEFHFCLCHRIPSYKKIFSADSWLQIYQTYWTVIMVLWDFELLDVHKREYLSKIYKKKAITLFFITFTLHLLAFT